MSNFIHAENFIESWLEFKDVFITGRKGSGKTLLSFALGHYALEQGYVRGIWSNIPHGFKRCDSVYGACVILDETSMFMDARFSAQSFDLYGQFSRKSKSLFVFPSVNKIDTRLRNLEIARLWNLAAIPGLYLWIYVWQNAYGERGWLGLRNPHKYFDTFESFDPPTSDGGTLASMVSLYPETVRAILDARGGRRLEEMLARADAAAGRTPKRAERARTRSRSAGPIHPVDLDEVRELREMVARMSTRSMPGGEADGGRSVTGFRN